MFFEDHLLEVGNCGVLILDCNRAAHASGITDNNFTHVEFDTQETSGVK